MAEAFDARLQKMEEGLNMADVKASFQRIKDQQKMEALRRGKKPQLSKNSQELRLSQRVTVLRMSAQTILSGQTQLLTTSSHKIDASKAPLKTLKRISLRDLRLEEAKKGGYLILRVLEPAFKIVGITTIVEDHEGNAVIFSVYNFTEVLNPNLGDILPIGTVFILKEPYIKISAANECMVRCDCPSDMIVVYKGHDLFPLVQGIKWKNDIYPEIVNPMYWYPVPKTALEWKERGNALFKDKKFEYATRCYLLSLQELSGLDNVGNLEHVVLLNVSAAYLQRGFFENGLEFARKVLKIDPVNRKALNRAGRCCYQLRKYEDAKQYFYECHTLNPGDEDTKKELQKAKDRLLEQIEGQFNMYKMFLTQVYKSRQKSDCADYAGPVKVIEIPGKGRGIVASEDIEPGTLLVVSKALVFDWAPENAIQFQVNHDSSADIGSSQLVMAQLAQMIAKNPNTFGPIVYDLYDGNQLVKERSVGLYCNPETKEEAIVDVQRIKDILKTNSFNGSYINPQLYHCSKVEKMIQSKDSGGLFILPSYFNHSCIPNANWQIFNDVMIIRAIQYIKVNEEVFLSYVSWGLDFSERLDMFKKRGFECDCRLCLQDSKVPKNIRSKRKGCDFRYQKIVNQIDENERIGEGVIRHTQRLMNDLVKTYESSEEIILNPTLFSMHTLLARAYSFDAGFSHWKYDKEIECHHKIVKLFGFDPQVMLESIEMGKKLSASNAYLTDHLLRSVAKLVFIHNCASHFDVRNKWIHILTTLENMYSGGDINVLKFKYGFIKDLL